MSEDTVMNNEGLVETLKETSCSKGNGLSKVVIAGVIIALGVATVMYIRKRKAKKLIESKPVIVNDEVNVTDSEE
jgi:hypothetical protein